MDKSISGDGPKCLDGSLQLDAAAAGQGVFLAWETLAADTLNAGRVVAPFPGRYATGLAYCFDIGRHGEKSRGVWAFEAWLRRELGVGLGG